MGTSTERAVLRTLRAAPAAGPAALGRDAQRARKALRSVPLRGRCAAAAAAGAASTNPAHRAAAVAHRTCPPAVLATAGQRLSARACDSASGAAAWAARSARHPAATRSRLARLAADPDSALRDIAASAPAATRPLLMHLLNDDEISDTAGVHPRTPPEAIDAASRTDPSIREAVASNLSAWPSTVQRLAADSDWDVRTAVAAHPSHTPDTLRDYCETKDMALEAGVAANPNCPEDLLVELSEHVEEYVRTWVALNPAADADMLEYIANSFEIEAAHAREGDGDLEDYEPWEALAENPNSPPDLIARVVDASGLAAQARAVANPNASAEMIEHVVASTSPTSPDDSLFGGSQGIVLCNAAQNPNCPVDLLPNLARDANEQVRAAVTKHPECPETLIEQLAGDARPVVRARAAASAACSTTALRALRDDRDDDVASAAFRALAARGLI